ncbi:MAG: CAP domain-containing protein [Pseudomonadota bacterium]
MGFRWVLAALLANPAWANPEATAALNAMRSAQGLVALSYSTALEDAAQSHADDMARQGYFAHRAPDGSDAADRVRRAGYDWCLVAENIAKGQSDLKEVMADWFASPAHRSNMLLVGAEGFGLARAEGQVWVMVLAARNC